VRFHQTLRKLRGWHIYEGVIKGTGRRARQKEVDILIAVDMLTHAYRRNMHSVTFIAGDQDFRPLVDALVRDGMFIELMYDPRSISKELADAADARRILDPYLIFQWLDESFKKTHPLPERYAAKDKKTFLTPPIETAETDFGLVELFYDEGKYVISHPYPDLSEHFLITSHSDIDFLKRVYEQIYGRFDWKSNV